jgi:K+-transporting ATPase ATPase A chain
MTPLARDLVQIAAFLAILTLATVVLGRYMASVFTGRRNVLTPVLSRIERFIYRVCGIDEEAMDWKTYAVALLLFNVLGAALLFGLLVAQSILPFNPRHLAAVPWDLALNIAVSFMTNTNWQSYAGETTLTALVQAAGLTVQNFLSAATGVAVMLALARGLANRASDRLGNFWVDLVRSTLYVLLPLSIIFALFLVSQGVVQTGAASVSSTTLAGSAQEIPLGPVASQVAIKQLGTNGGGYFNANSAHPFENPTPLSNLAEVIAILLLPSALVVTFGLMVGAPREGWTLWVCMLLLFLALLAPALWAELQPNPVTHATAAMEGKEVRLGVGSSVLWSVATTAASNGSVNAMHDSLTPLAGMSALVGMMLGEIVFGGIGSGLYGMIVFVLLTVFIAGLMVGRTPEYLGKKIESREVTMAALAVLAPCAAILVTTAAATLTGAGLAGATSAGPHGFSQILYACTSAGANNGSAFGGIGANTVFYNLLLAGGMLVGRFGVIVPMLAVAGSLSGKRCTPPSSGTFRTDTPLFAVLLIGVVLIVGALTFLPALTLGPVAEHLVLVQGRGF